MDAARFSYFLSLELQISPESICSPVIGVHGEQMVPVLSRANVQGIPISELLTPDQVRKAVERTIKAGAEITNLLQTGSAFYAPASAIAEMVRAIIYDTKKIIPCSVLLSGEYGINGIYIGAPAKIGISGVEQILELDLTEDENKLLNEGAVYIKSLLANLKL